MCIVFYDLCFPVWPACEEPIERVPVTLIREPHNIASSSSDRPDLFAESTDTGYDITVRSAYASAKVFLEGRTCSEAEKHTLV